MAVKKVETVRKVTSIAEMKQYMEGCVVEFPPFGVDQPFVAKVRRPSLMGMIEQGKIPNTLLGTAEKLFSGRSATAQREIGMAVKEMRGVFEVIASEMLVEPTFAEIKEAGIQLCDDQMVALFNYSQEGIKSLDNFRK